MAKRKVQKRNPSTHIRTTIVVDGEELRQLKSKLAAKGVMVSVWFRDQISKELKKR